MPTENYGKGDDPLCVDTLVAETNAGSVRWMNGFEEQPFSSQRLRDGEMFDYLLPVRGYSVDELLQMEEERLQKEKELQEKREKEEKERIKREEEEAAEAERLRLEEEKAAEAVAANATLSNFTGPLVEGEVVVEEDIDVMNKNADGDSSDADRNCSQSLHLEGWNAGNSRRCCREASLLLQKAPMQQN